ncbi:MAG: T9SS type A sorting domain-containing protein [Saprospiraceae bacterium]|nr:T9SS type A sorting domain-containing protein [Saprospiraceae bacterium]HMW39481.1 T9SS type A sorting domain-containing protein [Saprospiraceae bacterium]HMX88081.1 T9SS type A sorting domain-containing protein [Saprospiraceae bacterium]HMZ38952.1 T9SS type A sorting domain-containing protein [Saprospiraceae bacterium]HNA65420.1 T9SS type A sorting domain-containing protein [Saprospiraceae bacterium]
MKQFFTFFLLLCFFSTANAQNCVPDSTYRDSSAGVYPRPVIPGGTGKGIDKKACINKPYEFVFTVTIPDTLTIPGIPFLINLNFAKIDTTGAISNLPKGITYACNPPNCTYPKKTLGCLILKGTPTSDNLPGNYKPVIKLTIGSLLGNLQIDYPGVQFPGEYILELLDQNCLIATKDIHIVNDQFYPNPTEGWINSREDDISDLRLTDPLGRLISFQKSTTDSKFLLPENLNDGFYLLSWKSRNKNYIQKILLQRN